MDDLLPILEHYYGPREAKYDDESKKVVAWNLKPTASQDDPMSTAIERHCFVKHVTRGRIRLPALQLLEFEDRLRGRTFLVGPAVYNGFLSVADFIGFGIYYAFSKDLERDGLLDELPDTVNWMKAMHKLDVVQQQFLLSSLPEPIQEEERIACASYSLNPTWFGRNSDAFDVTVSLAIFFTLIINYM